MLLASYHGYCLLPVVHFRPSVFCMCRIIRLFHRIQCSDLFLMFCAADVMYKRTVCWHALVTKFSSLCLLGTHLDLYWESTGCPVKGFNVHLLVAETARLLRVCYLRCLNFRNGGDVDGTILLSLTLSLLFQFLPLVLVLEIGAVYWARTLPFSGCSGLTYWFFSKKKPQTYSYQRIQAFLQIVCSQQGCCLFVK